MRALWIVLSLAACGDDPVGVFDPNPLPEEMEPEPEEPVEPPVVKPFTVIRDLSGAVGYCTNQSIVVDAVPINPTVLCPTTKPTSLAFDNDDRDVKCRVGHVPEVDTLPFGDCPLSVAKIVELPITPTTARTDGQYRADVLYKDFDGATRTHSSSFYVHRSLDGAQPCPADPSTYPTDSRFFAEATRQFVAPAADVLTRLPSWIDPIQRKGTLPHAVPFQNASVGSPPFYQLHFKDVQLGAYRKVATVNTTTFATGTRNLGSTNEFDLPIWSLRHHIAFNGDRTLVIVRRAFESRQATLAGSPTFGVCTMPIRFGATGHRETFECDALVLNSAGEGFCMTLDEDGTITQAVFSLTMVAKLMRGSTSEGTPKSGDNSLWGPKRFSPITGSGTFGPDNVFEVGETVVLRP